MRSLLLGILAVLGVQAGTTAHAYPHFIGHGYPSCLNCHFNPLGNGPLTDYGRAVGADGIASGAFYPKSWNEEKIGAVSGFLFREPRQDHIRTQLNFRGMEMIRGLGSANSQSSWITMQASGQLVLKFLTDDRLLLSADFGYNPISPQSQAAGAGNQRFRSREHYLGFRPVAGLGIYAGFMDKAYGIRVAEHIAYSRVIPGVTQNDQTHGVMVHFLGGGFEGAVHGFTGNLAQSRDLRQAGFSSMVEHDFFKDHRIGASFLSSKNDYVKILSYSLHSRFSLNDGSAFLVEYGQTEKDSFSGVGSRISRYGLIQTYSRPIRGLYIIANIDYSKSDLSAEASTLRWGPGLQYFPIQKIELRTDLYNTRTFNPGQSTQDSWMLLLQSHIWI